VSDTNSPPHVARDTHIDVHDGSILNVRLATNHDRRHVASDHGAVPDARFLPQRHVSHDGCGRRNESCGVDRGRAHAAYGSRAGGNNI
jgi:hypothetical protein